MAREPLELMVDVLLSFGRPAYGEDSKLTDVAGEWLEAGFDPDAAGQWLEVSCWESWAARKFVEAKLEPEDIDPDFIQAVCDGQIAIETVIELTEKKN